MAQLFFQQSQDVDEQACALKNWRQNYEQLGCGRFRGSVWQLHMHRGSLLREFSNRPVAQHIVPPKDSVVLAMPLSVTSGSIFARRLLSRQSLMILSDQDQHELISSGESDIIALTVHGDAVAATIGPERSEWLENAKRQRHLELTSDCAALLQDTLLIASGEAKRQIESPADQTTEEALIARTLIQVLNLAMCGDCSDKVFDFTRRGDNRLRIINRAVEFMRANLLNDISIPQICAAAFTSRRTLQYCFEEFLRTAPQAYLRAVRLNEARRALKLRPDQPITELASLLGFSSASHFTRHYKRMFDELPSETTCARRRSWE